MKVDRKKIVLFIEKKEKVYPTKRTEVMDCDPN